MSNYAKRIWNIFRSSRSMRAFKSLCVTQFSWKLSGSCWTITWRDDTNRSFFSLNSRTRHSDVNWLDRSKIYKSTWASSQRWRCDSWNAILISSKLADTSLRLWGVRRKCSKSIRGYLWVLVLAPKWWSSWALSSWTQSRFEIFWDFKRYLGYHRSSLWWCTLGRTNV